MARLKKLSTLPLTKPDYDLIVGVGGEDFHLGYSRIASYLECPKKYAFSYRDKLPSVMGPPVRAGSAYHAIIEEMLLYKLEKGTLCPLDTVLAYVPVACAAQELTESKTRDVAKAVEMYWATLYAEEKPLVVEDAFSITRGGVTLTGRIDLVTTDGLVVDHKLSADVWAESRAKFGCQPMIYQWAAIDYLMPKYDITYAGFRYDVMRTFPSPQVQHILIEPLGQDESDWWEEQIHALGQAIRAGFFPANPKDNSCGFCQFKKTCNPTIYSPKIERRSADDED